MLTQCLCLRFEPMKRATKLQGFGPESQTFIRHEIEKLVASAIRCGGHKF